MPINNEIKALIKLIDDPDEVVYENVHNKIISIGSVIIPELEHCWENTNNTDVQQKLEAIIHQLHFTDLKTEFERWNEDNPDLLAGAMLVAKYLYPNLDSSFIFKEIEKLRRNIWLELNNYLTPLEQINVIGSIIYSYYKQEAVTLSYDNTDSFLINKALETKQGNTFANGTIFLILCGLLDVPVYAVNIPNQFLLAYFHEHYTVLNVQGHAAEKIKFYVDPLNGQMYSQKDVENFFKKMGLPADPIFFHPLGTKNIIVLLLSELAKCFDSDANSYRKKELREIIKIIITK
jgi:regulator of sirC expression with transglutaminase-like and TPR domain